MESELIKIRTKQMLWTLFEESRLKVASNNPRIGGLMPEDETIPLSIIELVKSIPPKFIPAAIT
jgi:hypothetical protein